MVPTRNSSSTGASSGAVSASLGGGDGGHRGVAAAAPHDLVEQLVDPLGERGDLGLLQGDAGGPARRGGLQEERPLARLPDRTGHETVRLLVEEDLTGHVLLRLLD